MPPVAALTQAELKFLGSMSTSSRAHFQPVPRDFGFHSPRDRGKLRDKVRAAVDATLTGRRKRTVEPWLRQWLCCGRHNAICNAKEATH